MQPKKWSSSGEVSMCRRTVRINAHRTVRVCLPPPALQAIRIMRIILGQSGGGLLPLWRAGIDDAPLPFSFCSHCMWLSDKRLGAWRSHCSPSLLPARIDDLAIIGVSHLMCRHFGPRNSLGSGPGCCPPHMEWCR